jgi:hypothetical protein
MSQRLATLPAVLLDLFGYSNKEYNQLQINTIPIPNNNPVQQRSLSQHPAFCYKLSNSFPDQLFPIAYNRLQIRLTLLCQHISSHLNVVNEIFCVEEDIMRNASQWDPYNLLIDKNDYKLKDNLSFISRMAFAFLEIDEIFNIILSIQYNSQLNVLTSRLCPGGQVLGYVDGSGSGGGFSEVILWNRRIRELRARGWGYNYSENKEAWLINQFNSTARDQAIKNFTVVNNLDVNNPLSNASLNHFISSVLNQSKFQGVKLCVSSLHSFKHSDSDKNHQDFDLNEMCEIFLAEMIMMLSLLDQSGSAVLRINHSVENPFLLSSIYLLTQLFESVQIYQPKVHSFGGMESYLICTKLLSRAAKLHQSDEQHHIIEQLMQINEKKGRELSQFSLFDSDILKRDEGFIESISTAANQLSANQLGEKLQLLCSTDKQFDNYSLAYPPNQSAAANSLLKQLKLVQ